MTCMRVSPSPDSTRFKVHRLWASCLLPAHPDSRDNVHFALRHPNHAQNFTVWSHSTGQVPCSRLGSTCSDVSCRPPCLEIFVMEGHMSTIFCSNFFCAQRINATRGGPFSKSWTDVATPPSLFFCDLRRRNVAPEFQAFCFRQGGHSRKLKLKNTNRKAAR